VDTGRPIAYDGLLRAARLAASIAGATGPRVEEIADEAMALLLMQDRLVNNPKAWVRSMAIRLAVDAHLRRRIRTDDLLAGLTATDRDLVIGQRTGYTVPELAEHVGLGEDAVRELLAAANKVVRRSGRRLAETRA
jgi:DNA-directed RNA polymerase specialized sigma24 family protein